MFIETVLLALLSTQPGVRPPVGAPPVKVAQAQKPAPAPAPAPAKKAPAKKPAQKTEAAKSNAQNVAPSVRELVARMQAFYEHTADFKADFRQDYTYKRFKRTQTSTGTVIFKKPALMRWDYQSPSNKTFVLAGDKVYALDRDAKLLTKASIGTNKLSASVTFLWGQGHLEDEFRIRPVACDKCQGTRLELVPLKPDPRFQKIYLEVDPKTAQVLKSTVIDPDGSENAITFTNLKTNVGVSTDDFKITPPPGTQVQDFTRPGK